MFNRIGCGFTGDVEKAITAINDVCNAGDSAILCRKIGNLQIEFPPISQIQLVKQVCDTGLSVKTTIVDSLSGAARVHRYWKYQGESCESLTGSTLDIVTQNCYQGAFDGRLLKRICTERSSRTVSYPVERLLSVGLCTVSLYNAFRAIRKREAVDALVWTVVVIFSGALAHKF